VISPLNFRQRGGGKPRPYWLAQDHPAFAARTQLPNLTLVRAGLPPPDYHKDERSKRPNAVVLQDHKTTSTTCALPNPPS
jgi:hypothetical protein